MKISRRKSLYGSIIMAVVLCMGTQVYAVNDGQEVENEISAVSEFIDEANVSDEYIAYIESGSALDTVPAIQDFSYLAESYDYLASIQNAGLQPSSYDLRTEGLVTPVVNQASLGVCWAISASEALTSSIIEQFPQESISSLPIAYFTFTNEETIESLWGAYDPYMSGGNDHNSIATLSSWSGAILNSTYFSDYVTGAEVPEEYRDASDYHLQDAYYLPTAMYFDMGDEVSGNIEIMQSLIMQGLPITVHYAAYGEGSYYNDETYAYNNSEWDLTDHEVLIIGWDDNYAKENFAQEAQPENDGAWLVQNSWGTSWGDEGCFWLSYEDPTLYVGSVYVLEEADNYTTNYGYDTTGWNYSVATSTVDPKTATAANIFTAESDEQLEAVSFYTTDSSVKYTISIYTGLTDKTDPTSGTQQLISQTGTQAYAGYHTIELSESIALKAGEQFSIVVTFENSTYDAPVPIELYVLNEGETEPSTLGNGGESYVLIEGDWQDIAGVSDALYETFGMDIYITNVCIKAFTNPLPTSGSAVSTVVFSEMEGPLADGTKITLEADGDETIYYTVNGSEVIQGSTFTVDFSQSTEYEIAAYAVDSDGNAGNTRTRTYTQASAQLVNLAVDGGSTSTYLDTTDYGTQSVTVSSSADSTRIMAQSSDTITIYNVTDEDNKIEIGWESDGLWSKEIPITEGETLLLEVVVNGAGKTSTTYKIEITGGAIEVNWTAETITYNDSQYIVTDKDGNEIASGGSIMYLINTMDITVLTVTDLITKETFTEELPTRPDMSGALVIDYAYEMTVSAFSDACYYSANADMSDATQCIYGENITLMPGEDIYIQRFAVEGTSFASTIGYIEVPDRPAAPVIEIEEQTTTTLKVEEIEGAIYRIDGGDWQYEAEFTGLNAGITYEIEVVLLATDSAFASEVGSLKVATLSSEKEPSEDDLGDDALDEDDANEDDLVIGGTTAGGSGVGNGESETVVGDEVVDTGDEALMMLWIVLILVSLFGIGVGRRFRNLWI